MSSRPSLSVVIPVHNRERLLAQAIDSLVPQLQEGDEIIVVDDASTDESVSVARRYPAVRVEGFAANRGAATALNHGVRQARHEWLAFLDSDDLAAPDRFVAQARALLADEAPDIVYGAQWRFSGDDWPMVPDPIPASQIELGPTLPAMLLRHATFLKVGFFDESLRAGYFTLWYAQARAFGLRIQHEPTVVLWRRAHSGAHLSQEGAQQSDQPRALKQILDLRRAAQALRNGNQPRA